MTGGFCVGNMKHLAWYTGLILIGFCISFGTGCKKKSAAASGAVESNLPEAAAVIAAVDKKDYDGAMAALIQAREGVTNDEQQVQFMVLSRQVQFKLNEVAATDPKANEALMSLRAMTLGR
jgi:hypothetical protein